MYLERAIRLLAGSLVVLGLILAYAVNPWFLALPAFVGLNLAQSAITGFCPAEIILRKLGVPAHRPEPDKR